MTILLLMLLGIIIAATLRFGVTRVRLPLEDADYWLRVISGVFVTLVFAAGLAALIVGHYSRQAQGEKILILQKEVAAAREQQAAAEKRLADAREKQAPTEERNCKKPRSVEDKFKEALRDKPTGEAVIIFVGGSMEVLMFAENVREVMNDLGWKVPAPTGVSSAQEVLPGVRLRAEIIILYKLPQGSKQMPEFIEVLQRAFAAEGYSTGVDASINMPLPDARPRIIIEPRT